MMSGCGSGDHCGAAGVGGVVRRGAAAGVRAVGRGGWTSGRSGGGRRGERPAVVLTQGRSGVVGGDVLPDEPDDGPTRTVVRGKDRRGHGVYWATTGVAHLHNLALTG